jgi:hypothetical protein
VPVSRTGNLDRCVRIAADLEHGEDNDQAGDGDYEINYDPRHRTYSVVEMQKPHCASGDRAHHDGGRRRHLSGTGDVQVTVSSAIQGIVETKVLLRWNCVADQ